MKNLITILCLSLNIVLGCIDGVEVELWGECYNIDTTTHLYLSGHWSDPDNQLTGEIPSEIGGLVNLEQIHLNGNHLSGEIPSEIWELINLENLHLSGNLLTGGIPSEIGNLINLTDLTLDSNQLSSIPSSIGSLIHLNNLYLYYNQLTGEIPVEIGNMINLDTLSLGGNQLTGNIPVEIGNMINLTLLGLGSNQLTGEIPSEIGNLTNLTYLTLYDNQFTGSIPVEIGNLTNLITLHLHVNQLTGSIPVEIGNLINLDLLHLSSNQLSGEIPESICDLTLDFNQSYPFQIQENNLCPPYPECIVYLGEQDTSECGELSNSDYIIEYSLNKPYPNPFNPTTTISFSVPNYDFVSIKVYDISGGLVSTLVEDHFNQGNHSLTWDGTDFSSGQYLVKMESGSFSKTQIISLIK